MWPVQLAMPALSEPTPLMTPIPVRLATIVLPGLTFPTPRNAPLALTISFARNPFLLTASIALLGSTVLLALSPPPRSALLATTVH